MNFYKAQDNAHKKTKVLIVYYFLAVIGTVIAMHAALAGIRCVLLQSVESERLEKLSYLDAFLDPVGALAVGGLTLAVIFVGWMYKKIQVSGGGSSVALALGGRLVDSNTLDPEEKQLINVVEEMAISSGLPVPQVWVMDNDEGVNAFAAGTQPGNAVIGVTRGTMQRLTRAELQGVVAHEFSHILNGDMRMNIRLMCMLHGLLLISIIGYSLMRIAFYSGGSRRDNREGNGAGMVIIAAGICMVVIGSIGAFFASMIQAAISRQREYLADASAVEFTMDPDGISGALKKIGGSVDKANISSPVASEMEHMFFASSGMFNYGLSTHPPLAERIGLIDPSWDGKFTNSTIRSVEEQTELKQQHKKPRDKGFGSMNPMGPLGSVVMGSMLSSQLGESSQANLNKGKQIVSELEPDWKDACHDKQESQLLIFGMLMAVDGNLQKAEVHHLKSAIGENMAEVSAHWQKQLIELHSTKKIALLDLCIPALRSLSQLEYQRFIKITQYLISSDKNVDLFEFMLQKVLQRHLDSHFIRQSSPSVKYKNIYSVADPANVILSTIVGVGAKNQSDLESAYTVAVTELFNDVPVSMSILPANQCGLDVIDDALVELRQASPLLQKKLLASCMKAVMHDDEVTSREAELLRAVADALGCTIAPFA